MSDNNTMYRMFRQMMQGYKLEEEGINLFEHAVHCWMDLNPDNPFPNDSEAFDHFFRMKNYYNVWKIHGADYRVNEKRMLASARALCATKPKNPYKFDKQAAEEERAALKELAKKRHEEEINGQIEADRLKTEREAERRKILEEIREDELYHLKEAQSNKAIVEEAKAEVVSKMSAVKEQQNKNYVFNVVEEPKKDSEKKKGWLKKLFKR